MMTPFSSDFAPLPHPIGIYPLVASASEAVAMADAGVKLVQLRIKHLTGKALTDEVAQACQALQNRPTQLILNDHWQLAMELGADGVHLGQEDLADLPQQALDHIAAQGLALGLSSHTPEEIQKALSVKPSYLAIGPIFDSQTKTLPYAPVGLKRLAQWVRSADCPVVAIGGIGAKHLTSLAESGVSGLAMIQTLTQSASPSETARSLQQQFYQAWWFQQSQRRSCLSQPTVLTIAGSDPMAGAGIQGDLKAIHAQGAYAFTVTTCITAQNALGVTDVHPLPGEWVREQLVTLLTDVRIDAVKIGALGNAEIVKVVAEILQKMNTSAVVLDPVLISSSGRPLLTAEGIDTLKRDLLPLVDLLTPNLPEAAYLTGVNDAGNSERLAKPLLAMGVKNLLIKGGHSQDRQQCCDRLWQDTSPALTFCGPRIQTAHTHGTGCLLASAIAAQLAQHKTMAEAVRQGHQWLQQRLAEQTPMSATTQPEEAGQRTWPILF